MTAPQHETRSISLGGQVLPYYLKRSARRTMGLLIDAQGLTVSIPLRLSLRETEAFIQSRARWILEKLATRPAPTPQATLPVQDGMQFPILGQACRVTLLAGANRAIWAEGFSQRELRLQLRRQEDARNVLLRGVQTYALQYFQGRLQEYAYVLEQLAPGLPLPALHLSSARTRWGSCSRRSGIRLNWRLIHLPPAQIDYVVAHEMAHLVEMNHSPRFWAVVAAIMPDYEVHKAALRHANTIIPIF